MFRQIRVANLLLEHDAVILPEAATPVVLVTALCAGLDVPCSKLIRQGVDCYQISKNHRTALHAVAEGNCYESILALLERDLD
jgi:hypothetical protein